MIFLGYLILYFNCFLLRLALTGAKLYGEAKHPRGIYTPCLLKYNGLIPHPRYLILILIKAK